MAVALAASYASNRSSADKADQSDASPIEISETLDADNGADQSYCSQNCTIEATREMVESKGLKAALDWVSSSEFEVTRYNCHAIHHAVGVDSGRKNYPEFPELVTADCQYGYLHGTLQGLATELSYDESGRVGETAFDKMLYWLDKGSKHCHTIEDLGGDSPSNVRGAKSECLHALGHGAAVIEFADLLKVLEACAEFGGEVVEACSDGAMMEYADDVWARAGWVHWDAGYTSVETEFDSASASDLCLKVPSVVEKPCWLRLGNLIGPIVKGDPGKIDKTCSSAPTDAYVQECLYRSGVVAIANAYRNNPTTWPPENDVDAQAWVRSAVIECRRWKRFDVCLKGFITPTASHIYTGNLGHLLARACEAEDGAVKETCVEALAQAEYDK